MPPTAAVDFWDQVGATPYTQGDGDPFADAPRATVGQSLIAEQPGPSQEQLYGRSAVDLYAGMPSMANADNAQRLNRYGSEQLQLEAAAMPDQRAGRSLGLPDAIERPIHATAETFAPIINIPFNVQAEGQTNRALQIEFEERKRMALGTHEDFATLMRAAEETGNAGPMRWFVSVVRDNPNVQFGDLAGELQATLLGNVEGAPAGHYGQPFAVSQGAIDALTRAHIAREWAIKPQMDAPQGVFENVGQIGGELVGQVAQLVGIGRLFKGSPLAKQAPGAVQPAVFGTHGAVTAAAQGQDPVEGFAHGAMLGGALGLGARAAQASGLPAMVGEATAGYAATQDPVMLGLPLIPGIRAATGGAIEGTRRRLAMRGLAPEAQQVPQYEQVNGQEVSNVPPSPPIGPEGQLPRPPAPPRGGSPTDQPKPMGDVQLVPAGGQPAGPTRPVAPPPPAAGPPVAPVQPTQPQAAPGQLPVAPQQPPQEPQKPPTLSATPTQPPTEQPRSGAGLSPENEQFRQWVSDTLGESYIRGATGTWGDQQWDYVRQEATRGDGIDADRLRRLLGGKGLRDVEIIPGQSPPAEAPPPATAPAITPEPTAGTTPPGTVAAEPPAEVKKPAQDIPENIPSPEGGVTPADLELMRATKAAIPTGRQVDTKVLFGAANKIYGGSVAEGKYTSQQAYEIVEAAINGHLAEQYKGKLAEITKAEDLAPILEEIADTLYRTMPPRGKRSEEQQQLQQFSTPPHYAALAQWVARAGKADTVLEPSAGTGSLIPLLDVSRVAVNDLATRRTELLKAAIPGIAATYNVDAAQIGPHLHGKESPSVIIMNPPFSQSAVKGKWQGEDRRHIESALKILQPGGRLVAIVGGGMPRGGSRIGIEPAGLKNWIDNMPAKYRVRADVGISGEVYKRYGTAFPTRLLVIDKPLEGAEFQQVQMVRADFESLADAAKALQGVYDERTAPGQQSLDQPGVQEPAEADGAKARPDRPVQPAARADSPPPSAPPREPVAARGDDRPVGRDEASGRDEGGVSAEPVRDEGESAGVAEPAAERSGEGDLGDTGDAPRGRSDIADAQVEHADAPRDIGESNVTSYQVTNIIPGSKPHPAVLVEPAAMAAVKAPKIDYAPKIPKRTIESGDLSMNQLEAIAEAGAAHAQTLPAPEDEQKPYRRGHMSGFGTGFGKGATFAGMFLDNRNRGRTRGIWFTVNEGILYNQALRDMVRAGFTEEEAKKSLVSFEKAAKKGDKRNRLEKLNKDNTILLVSYSKLIARQAKGKGLGATGATVDPVTELIEWFGKDYDGLIVFDEAHRMGNGVAVRGARGTVKPAQTAVQAIRLQNELWNARIEYGSATAATEVNNLAYMGRLGLWGYGTPFADQATFLNEVSQGGMAMMEMVAREMKQLGMYKVADLAMWGKNPDEPGQRVEFERVEHRLTPEQRELHASLSNAWSTVIEAVDGAMKSTGADQGSGRAQAAIRGHLWSANLGFWRQVMVSLAMPTWRKIIQKDLDEGRSPIVQFISTGEANLNRAVAAAREEMEAGEDVEFDSSPRDILIGYIRQHFPTTQFGPNPDDPDGALVPVLGPDGTPLEDPDAIAARDALITKLNDLPVPAAAMDQVIDKSQGGFGTNVFAEITGRSNRIVDGRLEKRPSKSNEREQKLYLDGDKMGLVLSGAGSTGIDAHAGVQYKNQARRGHNIPQPPWSATQMAQFLGRSHRTAQVSYPIYRMVDMPDLPGWGRFVSAIARRMQQMGALTRGERRASGQDLFSELDDMENAWAQDAFRDLVEALWKSKTKPGSDLTWSGFISATHFITKQMIDEKTGQLSRGKIPPVKRFLNRVLNMSIEDQGKWYGAFIDAYERSLEFAKASNQLDVGTEVLKGDDIKLDEDRVIAEARPGATTRYIRAQIGNRVRKYPFAEMEKKQGVWARNARSHQIWFFEESKRTMTNDVTGGVEHTYRKWSVTGQAEYVRRSEILEERDFQGRKKWETIEPDAAQPDWDKKLAAAPDVEYDTYHLIAGSLLPVWDKLPRTQTATGGYLARVYRMKLPSGETVLGRQIEQDDIDNVLRNFGSSPAGAERTNLSAAEAVNAVLFDGKTLSLHNGWSVARKLVNGEQRMEVLGVQSGGDRSMLIGDGAFTEVINHKTRVFLPTGDNAVRVMAKVLQSRTITAVKGRDQERAAAGDAGAPAGGGPAGAAFRRKMARAPVEPSGKRVIRLLDIRDALSKGLKIPIRARHQRYGKRAGFYRTKDPSVWSKRALDIATITHEVGHHIEKVVYGGLGNLGRYSPAAVRRELLRAGKRLYGKRVPPYGYKSEGFAEYLRLRLLLGKTTAAKHMPATAKLVEPRLADHAAILNTLDKAEQMVNDYVDQGLVAQFAGQIVSGLKRRGNYWTRMMNAFFDPYYAIAKAEKEGEKATGIPLRPSESPYALLSHVTLKADSKSYSILTEDLRDINGKPMGPSLKEIIKPIISPPRGARRILKRSWEQYTLGRDLILEYDVYDKARRGARAEDLGIDFGFPEGAERVVDYLERLYPFFKDVHKERVKFTDALLEYAHQAGAIKRDDINAVKKVWLDTYTPMIAFDPQDVKAPTGAGTGKHRGAKAIGHRKEGGEARLNFLEAHIRYIRRVVRAADNARINRAIVAAYDRGGMGDHIRKIEGTPRPVSFNLERIKAQLAKEIDLAAATGPGGVPIDWDAFLSVWVQPHEYRGNENIISMLDPKTQKVRFFEVDPEWARALQAVDMEALPAFMAKTIGVATRAKKFGITGPFALSFRAANAFADAFMYPAYSEGPYATAYGRLLKGYFKALFGEAGKRFEAQGGTVSGFQGIDQRHMKVAIDAAMASGVIRKALHLVKHPVELTRMAIVDVFEMGPRVAEYDYKYKDALSKGWGPEDANLMAVAAGRNVTIDFSKIGNQARWITQIWAYSAASLGGIYTFAQKARTNKRNFWTHGLVTMFGTLALWWTQKDEPWYRDMADWLKHGFWTFKTKTGTLIRLRIPWEFGWAFASLPRAIVDAAYRKDPQLVKDALGEAMNSLVPPFLPDSLDFEGVKGWIGDISAIGPLAEVGFNEESFTKRPIVPRSVEDLPSELQESRYTTELGKILGKSEIAKKVGLGPAQVDHLLGEWSGGAITRGAEIIESTLKGQNLESRATPIVRRFTVPPEGATKWVGEYYDRLGELEKKKAAQTATKERNPTYRLSGRERDELERLRDLKPMLRELQERQRRAKSTLARQQYQEQIDNLIKRTMRRAG